MKQIINFFDCDLIIPSIKDTLAGAAEENIFLVVLLFVILILIACVITIVVVAKKNKRISQETKDADLFDNNGVGVWTK